jgi:hypothetical protein
LRIIAVEDWLISLARKVKPGKSHPPRLAEGHPAQGRACDRPEPVGRDLRRRPRRLVLADQAPVPPALQGTNPVPQFDAIISCQTINAAEAATVTNVSTAAFPASTAGNADINATVSLPHPCIAPIVFVPSPVFGLVRRERG